MKIILNMVFGSHLYGTNTPASDEDYKGIFIPDRRDLLLQRAPVTIQTKPQKELNQKNKVGDVDWEMYALHRYMQLLCEGQTVALDMLFAPKQFVIAGWDFLHELQRNRHSLISKRANAFVGYCRTQANKYGIRGSRVAAARALVNELEKQAHIHGWHASLNSANSHQDLEFLARSIPHMNWVDIPNPMKPLVSNMHVMCCGKKIPMHASIKEAHNCFKKILDSYGERALAAERNEGIDWKALSHAVRVGSEALELLTTGNITFPLPNAAHVLAIKRGELKYQCVAEEIEKLLAQVDEASITSTLPENPDMQFVDDLVYSCYEMAT